MKPVVIPIVTESLKWCKHLWLFGRKFRDQNTDIAVTLILFCTPKGNQILVRIVQLCREMCKM